VSTAHSIACDDDRPAPTGTSEASAIRAGGTSKPASRSAQTTPATYPAQPSTLPGSGASKETESGAKSVDTVQPGSGFGAAAAITRSGSANGSTYPSL
jgi:hypothetical protein